MSYGVQVVDVAGKTFDTTLFSAVTYDSFTSSTSTPGSKSYPELAGFTIYAFLTRYDVNNAASASGYVSVSYPSGIPTVSWGLLVSYGAATNIRIYVMVS